MTTGDIEYSLGAALMYTWIQFGLRPLPETVREYERLRERITLYGQETVFKLTKPALQMMHNLLGRSGPAGPTFLQGEIMDDSDLHSMEKDNETFFVFANFHLMMLNYLFGDLARATASAKVIRTWSDYPPGGMEALLVVFFDGLVAARNAQVSGKWKYRRRATKLLRRFEEWAKYSPRNFLCRQFLLDAEIRVAVGDHLSVHSKYVAAIALAKAAGFLDIIALANELAARYYFQRNENEAAKPFLREALEYYLYIRWGALAKAEHLSQEFNSLGLWLSSQSTST